jgi:maleate isomerase
VSEIIRPRAGRKDARLRVALLVPSSNTVMENDLHRGLPHGRYTVHTGRMYLVETTREGEIAMIEQHAPRAAADLGTAAPDLFVFGCTSGGSLFGLDYDARLCRDLGARAGCPAIGVITSVTEAVRRRAPRRVAVITPYNEDLTTAVAEALRQGGLEVTAAHGMGITDNVALADPRPEDILAFGQARLAGAGFDLIVVSCTNFRALEAKPMLEAAFGRPVVTSNSAVLEAIRLRCEGSA